jgi:hypothetical protein
MALKNAVIVEIDYQKKMSHVGKNFDPSKDPYHKFPT